MEYAYKGYMYGDVYFPQGVSTDSLYGKSFTYSNGTYTLTDTQTGADNYHHYTCGNTSDTCTTIYYMFYTGKSYALTWWEKYRDSFIRYEE